MARQIRVKTLSKVQVLTTRVDRIPCQIRHLLAEKLRNLPNFFALQIHVIAFVALHDVINTIHSGDAGYNRHSQLYIAPAGTLSLKILE